MEDLQWRKNFKWENLKDEERNKVSMWKDKWSQSHGTRKEHDVAGMKEKRWADWNEIELTE